MGKSIRQFFNTKFIESNPHIVEEMSRHNRIYGRFDGSLTRMKYVLSLYWYYTIRRKNPIEEKNKRAEKLTYPETESDSQLIQRMIEESESEIRSTQCIIFDLWDTLVHFSLSETELLALFESTTLHPGILEDRSILQKLTIQEKQAFQQIIVDFTIDMPCYHRLFQQAYQAGKKIILRNNSHFILDEYCEAALKSLGYDCTQYEWFDPNQAKKHSEIQTIIISERYPDYKLDAQYEPYRPFYEQSLVQEMYDAVVNTHFHADTNRYSLFYEYGFTAGGLLTCGFCQYLNRLAKQEKVEKIIFVARDGEIMKKVYDRFFKEVDTEYLIFSRFASYALIFDLYPEEYLKENVKRRINRSKSDNSIGNILRECGLDFLKEKIGQSEIFQQNRLSIDEPLTDNNYPVLKEAILQMKQDVIEGLKETNDAAKQYILELAGDAKKVCIVDLGWRGTSFIYLKALFEKYQADTEVVGTLIGAVNSPVTQSYIDQGEIYAYAFRNDKYRGKGYQNGRIMSYEEILATEFLFSSEADTLLGYRFGQDKKTAFIYGKPNQNKKTVSEIHKGIMDFAEKFVTNLTKYGIEIDSSQAIEPLNYYLNNRTFLRQLIEQYHEEEMAINGF